jgi:hypothetical protein
LSKQDSSTRGKQLAGRGIKALNNRAAAAIATKIKASRPRFKRENTEKSLNLQSYRRAGRESFGDTGEIADKFANLNEREQR